MHWNNFSSSTRVAPARVEEDDEHCHDNEEAQGPQEVVQEDVHLGAPTVIRSLPGGKISSFQSCGSFYLAGSWSTGIQGLPSSNSVVVSDLR